MENCNKRIAIVAPDASAKFGGEAILPLHYFRHLRARGTEVWLVLHERTRSELTQVLGEDIKRVMFVPDTKSDVFLYRLGAALPARIGENSFGFLLRLSTQIRQKRLLRRLIREQSIDLVHEPSPVSPKTPSLMYGLGIPVIIGPMNGGMGYPKPFDYMQKGSEKTFVAIGRWVSPMINRLLPGKPKADLLLVANARTASALPIRDRSKVVELVENGVDFSVFSNSAAPREERGDGDEVSIFFVGRLVKWKAVDLLLQALKELHDLPFKLHIVGDGPEMADLKQMSQELGLAEKVVFHGFVPQKVCAEMLESADIMVLPSLYECGGAVVLEAMAMRVPVVATNWGGPADYLNDQCGILVDTGDTLGEFTDNLTAALRRLIGNGELRRSMGEAGLQRVREEFSWDAKIDRICEIYDRVLEKRS